MLPKKHPSAGPGWLMPSNLERLKGHLSTLAREDRQALIHYLQELAEAEASREAEASPPRQRSRDVVKKEAERSVVYQLEYVRCGKEKCRCTEGQGHGPYWYGYYRSSRSGRVVSEYIGKEKREIKPR